MVLYEGNNVFIEEGMGVVLKGDELDSGGRGAVSMFLRLHNFPIVKLPLNGRRSTAFI